MEKHGEEHFSFYVQEGPNLGIKGGCARLNHMFIKKSLKMRRKKGREKRGRGRDEETQTLAKKGLTDAPTAASTLFQNKIGVLLVMVSCRSEHVPKRERREKRKSGNRTGADARPKIERVDFILLAVDLA